MTPPLITSPPALTRLASHVASARRVALSTEDSSVRAFRPRICLLALSVEDAAGELSEHLVDVQAFERLPGGPEALLGPALNAARVVVHAGEHAVAALKRDLHLTLPRLVDTACAAILLGLPRTGYRALCDDLLGRQIALPPSVDWRLRPLSPESCEGAQEGARHLLALHDALASRVAAAELDEEWTLASAEVAATRIRSNLTSHDSPWRLPETRALRPEQQAVLARLVTWREDKAREFDCPPGQIVPNRVLVQLARASGDIAAERLAEPSDPGSFHSRLMWADREELRLILVSAGEHPGPLPEPRREPRLATDGRPTPAAQGRLKRLKAWRTQEAQRRGVGLQGVLPAAVMEHLARRGPEGLRDAPGLGTSRLGRYGATLASLLADASTET